MWSGVVSAAFPSAGAPLLYQWTCWATSLVGYGELQKGPANKTDLNVVLRSKQVLIGCGGGF